MKKQPIKIWIITVIIILASLVSCKKEIEIAASGITISPANILLEIESNDTLRINITPSNATNKNIIWSSSNSSVVTVNSSGVITTVAPGTAIVTATLTGSNKTDTCIVNSIKWTSYNSENVLVDNSIHSIIADAHDNIWCGGNSLSKYDGAGWTTYLSNQGIGYIAMDNQSNYWFGTYGYGVSKFDGTNWNTYTSSNSGLTDDNVSAMAIDPQGSIWIGTYSRITWSGTGVSKFNGTTWSSYTTTNTNNGLAYDNVSSIAIDKQGNKWFLASHNEGMAISKFDGVTWTKYSADNTGNSSFKYIDCIAVDANGNMWFGTATGDVLKFDGTNWITYHYSDDALSGINTIAFDSYGNIWIGTEAGVSKFDGLNWTKYNYKDLNYSVSSITFDSKNNKWFGTSYGVLELQD